MTLLLPPGVSLGDIPAGGVLADSDWTGGGNTGTWEYVSFAPKAINGRIRIQLADLVKLGGPEGYIHGYICVRPPCGPQNKEAEFNGKLGEVRHEGVRIGKMRKNDDGTYSMSHTGNNGRVKLTARYATRADAAKSVALYHNVDKLRSEAGSNPAMKSQIARARMALAAGDTDGAAMFLAQAEANAGADGNRRLESHIRDTRAAIVDGPKAVSPPDMAGLRFGSKKPVPGLPPRHSPLPEDIRRQVNGHLLAMFFAHHNQRVTDKVANAQVALNARDSDAAMKHLADAYDAAFEADDQNAMDHLAPAHDLIAAHLGAEMLNRRGLPQARGETATDHGAGPVPKAPAHGVPPVKLPAGEEPGTPKVPEPRGPKAPAGPKARKLPKAKAAAIDEELHAAQIGTGIEYSRAHDIIVDARADVADGKLEDARTRMAEAHEALAGNPIAVPARHHLALADEQLAAHLKTRPFQARTITHADDHAPAIAGKVRDLVHTGVVLPQNDKLDYLLSADGINGRLEAGNAGQVIRDLREMDARAADKLGYEWNNDRKTLIKEARSRLKLSKQILEKVHQQDLSDRPLQDRIADLAQDARDAGDDRNIATRLQRAWSAIVNDNDLDEAKNQLSYAHSAAMMTPALWSIRQFAPDIDALRENVDKAKLAQLAAGLRNPGSEAVTGTGLLGDIQKERNEVRAQLVTGVRSGVKVKKAPTVRGAIGETSLVTFNDGSRWVHKAPGMAGAAGSDKEELASLVARAMGVRAPVVVRDPLDSNAIYMTMVDGKTAAELGADAKVIIKWGTSPEASDMMRRIGFMDYLIKNPDRHSGNFMLGEDGVPVAIDHGNAWSMFPGGSRVTDLLHKSDFSSEYYAEVHKNLAAIQPEFAKVAGQDQKYYQTMMKQLDKWMAWDDNGVDKPPR